MAEYWCIGGTTMRFFNSTPRIVIGENSSVPDMARFPLRLFCRAGPDYSCFALQLPRRRFSPISRFHQRRNRILGLRWPEMRLGLWPPKPLCRRAEIRA